MTIRGIPVSMTYPIMKTIARKGYSTEQFCEYASFDSRVMQHIEARIPNEQLALLMSAAASFTGDEHFGLHQGAGAEVLELGPLGYVMMHSGTIGEALSAFRKYHDLLCSEFNIEMEQAGNEAVIRLLLRQPMSSPGEHSMTAVPRHCTEDMAASIYRLMITFSNRSIPLLQVKFSHAAPSEHMQPYAEVFGLVPQFGSGDNALRLPAEVLSWNIVYSDPRLRMMFESIAEQTRVRLKGGMPTSDQLADWLLTQLPNRLPDLTDSARALLMSTRTLQARLKEEQTSFHKVLSAVRHQLAVGYLANPHLSVADVAYLLRFSEPSAFQNAFKRWTGQTPGQYRKSVPSSVFREAKYV